MSVARGLHRSIADDGPRTPNIRQVTYPYFLLIAILLELIGGLLFIFNSKLGAQFLVRA